MNSPTSEISLNRVAVAIGASGHENRVLETIAALCTGTASEISYVYVEDTDLLRAAGLPFAVELSRATQQVKPVSAKDIERQLRANATAIKRLVASRHHESNTAWSFSVVRQRTANVVLELTRTTGPTIFVAADSIPTRAKFVEHSARRTTQTPGGIVVIIDRCEAGEKALVIARKLAQTQGLPLHCLAIEHTEDPEREIISRWRQRGVVDSSQLKILRRPRFEDIVVHVRDAHPTTLVVPISLLEAKAERIHQLGATIHTPILIVP